MRKTPQITLNDGNTMPQLGLGVWKAEDGAEVEHAIHSAVGTGYRLIDTAAVYRNEGGVGNAIASSGVPRDELFVTTKLWNSDQGAENVRPAFEQSLERLKLDYVDLYLIHWPLPNDGLFVETWREFEKLRNEGLIRSIGVSNFRPEDLDVLAKESETVPAINQIELHPYFNQQALRDYNKDHGIVTESWSPIGGSKGDLLTNETIVSIAQTHNKTAAQVVLRWHIQHGLVVIPKSVNPTRIAENFDVFDFSLSEDDMQAIDGLDTGVRQGADPATMDGK